MKKTISAILLLFFSISVSSIFANEKQDLWVKAISEKNLESRLAYLEQFGEKYKNDKRFFKNLYINLTKTAFQLRNFDKTIMYGEKAITTENLEANYKLELYLYIANAYNVTKVDLDKAFQYAGMVVDLAETIKKGFRENSNTKVINQINNSFEAPSLRIQASILYSKGNENPEDLKKALDKALQAYKVDYSSRSADKIFSYAVALYKKDRSKIDDSIAAVEELNSKSEQINSRYINILSHWYLVKKDKNNAVKYLKISYDFKKKSSTALKLGQLLYKTSPNIALEYFAESFLLSDSDKESKAYKYLQQLWFNQVAKKMSPKEQNEGFKQMIETAKNRLESSEKTEEDKSKTDDSIN